MNGSYDRGAPPGLPGRGHLALIPVPQPAAGADWTIRPPVGARWRVLGGSAKLVTSAAIANRQVYLAVSYDGLELFRIAAAAVQAAGATVVYELIPGLTLTTAIGGFQPVFLPLTALLDPRMVLASVTGAIDVGDQWSGVVLFLEELETLPYAVAAGARAPGAQPQE